MKYILLYVLLTFFSAVNVDGQTGPHVYYFDKDLKVSTKDSAVFTGMGWDEDNHIKLRCFNNNSKTVVFLAYFKDTTLKVSDGLFQSYYRNGDVENDGNFVNGQKDGLWKRWDEFQYLMDSVIYQNGKPMMIANFSYHLNSCVEKETVNDVAQSKIYSYFYDNLGKSIYRDTVDTRPGADSVFITPEVEAEFPGGASAWIQYITDMLKKDRRALKKERSGTCNVRFEVDAAGKVSNMKVLTMDGSALCKLLQKAVFKVPAWIPAMEKGRQVKSIKSMQLTYSPESFETPYGFDGF